MDAEAAIPPAGTAHSTAGGPVGAARPGTDVAVVGGGVMALAVALELLQRDLTVTVVAPRAGDHDGQATRAAGAMLSTFSEIEPQHSSRRTAMESLHRNAAHRAYPAWLDRIHAAGGHRVDQTAGTWVVAPPGGRTCLAVIARAARAAGHPAHEHDVDDVPGVQVPRSSAGALWLPTEARIDSAALMAALTAAVAAHPACTWRDTTARHVAPGRPPTVVCAEGGTVRAGTVVVAAGAATGALLSPWGTSAGVPPILAGRGVSATLHPAPGPQLPFTVRTPNAAFACGVHLVPRDNGGVYLGGTNRLTLTLDPGDRPALDEVQILLGDARALLDSGLGGARLDRTRVGYRPYTLDHLPLIGRTGEPNVLLSTATYRCGVLLAPHLARLTAEEITNPGTLDEHPYRVLRDIPVPELADVLADGGSTSLLEHLLQGGGHLHPAQADRLASFAGAALRALTAAPSPTGAALRRLWRQAPVVENLPALYGLAARLENR